MKHTTNTARPSAARRLLAVGLLAGMLGVGAGVAVSATDGGDGGGDGVAMPFKARMRAN
jgi:hypothetical protein